VATSGRCGGCTRCRGAAPSLPNAGWHLSWLGGRERAIKKVGSFCHPEVEDRIVTGLDDNRFMNDGVHVDGLRMFPVEIDRTYPRWIQEGKHPASWVELPLGTEYDRLCRIPSDIVDHLPRFYEMVTSRNVKHVIELGTRSGVSTIAWLHALAQTGGKLTSVDIDQRPAIGDHAHWSFIQGDDCDPKIMAQLEPADVVFIDTSHLYDHTLRELNLYKRLVKPGGLMVLHDTMLEQPIGAPPSPRFPVRVAIEEFCAAEGLTWTEFKDSWGLGVIEL
jgi:SAM-dependent methyltransferase